MDILCLNDEGLESDLFLINYIFNLLEFIALYLQKEIFSVFQNIKIL